MNTAVPHTGAQLLGYNQDRNAAQPGEVVLLTLFWERQADSTTREVELALLNVAGETVADWKRPFWNNAIWQTGNRLRGQYLLRLPAGLESGDYQFILQGNISLGEIEIAAPDRIFEQPAVKTAVNIPFSGQNTLIATLTGYTASPITDYRLPITLFWQAIAETPTSYRVFVHLLDADGTIIAQSDGEPANWTRPTTGWNPGEYIIDQHTLTLPNQLPAGPLTFRIGLYDPATGTRLQTSDGDAVELIFTND